MLFWNLGNTRTSQISMSENTRINRYLAHEANISGTFLKLHNEWKPHYTYKILSTMYVLKTKIFVCSIKICVYIKHFTWQLCTFCKFDPFDITLLVDLPVLDGYASLALRTSARNLNFYSPFNNSLSWASAKIKLHFTMPGF